MGNQLKTLGVTLPDNWEKMSQKDRKKWVRN